MLQPPPEKRESRPVTLGGVIVIVLVVGLFAALLVPAWRRTRESAKRVECGSNLKQLGFAIHMYAQDHRERLPAVGAPRGEGGIASLALLYPKYVADPSVFACPSDEDVTPWDGKERLDAAHCSYGCDHGHGSTDPSDVPIVADCTGVNESSDGLPTCHFRPVATMKVPSPENGLYVLYIDGHVKWAGRNRKCGRNGDDIFTKSDILPPEEDSWITQ